MTSRYPIEETVVFTFNERFVGCMQLLFASSMVVRAAFTSGEPQKAELTKLWPVVIADDINVWTVEWEAVSSTCMVRS